VNTILLVEDDQALNMAFRTVLTKAGYNVVSAFHGLEALEYLSDNQPQLILLDLLMPKLNGINFLKRYQPTVNHPTVRIIVFSNLDTEPEIAEAMQLGAHKYLLKADTTPKQLVESVKATLKT